MVIIKKFVAEKGIVKMYVEESCVDKYKEDGWTEAVGSEEKQTNPVVQDKPVDVDENPYSKRSIKRKRY